MGLDGGTIISRSDVLRGASWDVASADEGARSTRGGQVSNSYRRRRETADARCAADGAWTTCALSGEPLRDGEIVACALGRLYNKQAVVEHLLAMRGTYTEDRVAYQAANLAAAGGLAAHAHLRSLRDVFALHPQPAREAVDASACATEEDELRAAWECPVSGARPGRGGVAFSALRPCGHVVATRVLLNVPEPVCGACAAPFTAAVALHPPPEAEALLRATLEKRKRPKRDRAASSEP